MADKSPDEVLAELLDALAAIRDASLDDAKRWAAGAVETETLRLRREREVHPRRVAHDIIETEEVVETWADHLDNIRQPKIDPNPDKSLPGLRRNISRRNALDVCPDCGRNLVSANDPDLPRGISHLLVCPRLHGLAILGVDLTNHDVVACGVTG